MLETCLQFKISFAPKHMVLAAGEVSQSPHTKMRAESEIWAECLMRSDESALFCLLWLHIYMGRTCKLGEKKENKWRRNPLM
jgi:hypothetical protein